MRRNIYIYRFCKIDVSSLSEYSSFQFLPSRLVLEKQAKLNFEAEIPFVWRADEMSWRQFRADSEFATHRFRFRLSRFLRNSSANPSISSTRKSSCRENFVVPPDTLLLDFLSIAKPG